MNLDFTVVISRLPYLLKAALVTVEASALVLFLGSVFGIIIGVLRVSPVKIIRFTAATMSRS